MDILVYMSIFYLIIVLSGWTYTWVKHDDGYSYKYPWSFDAIMIVVWPITLILFGLMYMHLKYTEYAEEN